MNAREINFAYKVRHALNEQLEQLPEATVDRLAAARKQAMAVRRQDATPLRSHVLIPALAGSAGAGGGFFGNAAPWLGRATLPCRCSLW